jgi:pseudouridine synthase
MLERLQKILSQRGIASRRKAEEYILRGLVTVNGKVAEIGQKADPARDDIRVGDAVLQERAQMQYILLYKPVGIVTENVPRVTVSKGNRSNIRGRVTGVPSPSVRDILPPHLRGKVFPVGRLDKDSEGLLLLTNDGALAYRLTHPKFNHEKEYEVMVKDPVKDGQLRKLQEGVTLDGSRTKPARAVRVGENIFRIAITEGRNRQIRRMCQKVGATVVRLRRMRILTLHDPQLQPGALRQLRREEVEALRSGVGLSV